MVVGVKIVIIDKTHFYTFSLAWFYLDSNSNESRVIPMPLTNLIQHPVHVDADGYEYSSLEIRVILEEAHKVLLCKSFISTTCKSKDLKR